MKRIHSRQVAVLCVALCFAGSAWGATATVKKGTLSTTVGDSITDDMLNSWLGTVNANSKKLVVLTECFGGNTATGISSANTAVISATSPGEKAKYGAYDNGAAGGLTAGAGKTGTDVHNAGIANKAASETPSTGGTMAPGSFPLDPIGTNNIESRHVIVYAGQPGGPNNEDVNQRNTIKGNFPNQGAGNSVQSTTTVGGAGGGGWDQPGSAAGLKKAIDDAQAKIAAAANPDKEQLILFVTDHGDEHKTQTRSVNIPSGQTRTTTDVDPTNGNSSQNGLRSFQTSDFVLSPSQLFDNTTTPGFSVFLPFDPSDNNFSVPIATAIGLIQPGLWSMLATPSVGSSAGLSNPTPLPLDIDGDGIIGDAAGEGVRLEFPVTPGTFTSFFDVFVELDLSNGSGLPWSVGSSSQDTGPIIKDTPEPASLGLLGLGLFSLLRRRK